MPPWVWIFSLAARWNASVADTRAAAAAIGSSAAFVADRPPEGVALGRIGSRHFEAGLRAAHLLERDEDGGAVEQGLDQIETLSGRAERFRGDVPKNELRLVAGGIEAFQRSFRHAGIAEIDQIQRGFARAVGGDHGEIGDLAVGNRELGSAELAVGYVRLDAYGIGIAGALRERQRADALARYELR